MKDFIKNVFSSALGFFLALGVMLLAGIIFMVGAVASSGSKPTVKDGSVLLISLNGAMQEQVQDNPLSSIMGGGDGLGLSDVLEAIRKAKHIDKIKGIYLDGGSLAAEPASLQEVRKALADFRESGKFIVAYADNYMQGSYYLASVADKVALNPSGMVFWKGLCSMQMFYKDALEKLGVNVQVFKVGTFKSAVEPFIRTGMSEPNREQVTSYLNSVWNNFVADVSESRHIPAEQLQALADEFQGFREAGELVENRLVDTLVYIDGAKALLKSQAGVKEKDKLNLLSVADVCQLDDPKAKSSKNKVAVYYAFGDIVDEAPNSINPAQGANIVGQKVVKDMQQLEDDKDVKAVVLRINSGGGSAYASEQMWHAIKKLDAKKPVIISMGGLAASGGYYMSCAGQYIFAEPTTITGSIGIFGMIPDVSGLLRNKAGLKFDNVKTNKMADFDANMSGYGTMSRPFSEEEGALLQNEVERGYALFLSRVAEGRRKTSQQVDSIGQGRVWTGEQALGIGLVDKLGTLDDAIAYAAQKAKLGKDYQAASYPEAEPWYMNLLNEKKSGYYDSQLRQALGDLYEPYMMVRTIGRQDFVQARLPYTMNIH
ncbi:MAG: signal peptide peptidase SppA [Bacteroidaceae bacterium]|nr:signal peptide peptidase SppA [Bacteroidaceae bacterium]